MGVPCEKLMRNTSPPISARARTSLGVDDFGPRVQTSFTRRLTGTPYSRLEAEERERGPTDLTDDFLDLAGRAFIDHGLGKGGRYLRAEAVFSRLDPRLGYRVGNLGGAHLCEVDRPGPGHDAGPLVATTAGRDPSAGAGILREPVQGDRRLPVGPRRQPKVRDRIGVVGVAAELRDEHLWTPRGHDRHHRVEGAEPPLVAGPRRERPG